MRLTPELRKLQLTVEEIARGYGLDMFPTVYEIVSFDQMNELAAYSGMPVRYPHWRHGMSYERNSKSYAYGMQKIFEMVINNDPCYAYLLDTNSRLDNKFIFAHVCGHNDFFKNNRWFSETNRKTVDEMANHGTRIRRYYDMLGIDKVEKFIDACLSIEDLIDPYSPIAGAERKRSETGKGGKDGPRKAARQVMRLKAKPYLEDFINPPEYIEAQKQRLAEDAKKARRFPPEPVRDVVDFIIEYAPLDRWQRDILSIVREEAAYFLPQIQTKIMNEGWASYWHSRIMTEKIVEAREIVDFADRHAATMTMTPGSLNPYKIGMEIYRHIEERWDKGRFGPEWDDCDNADARRNWDRKLGLGREKIFEVRKIHNDITFIEEFLDQELCERLKLFVYGVDSRTGRLVIVDRDHRLVKNKLLSSLTNFGRPLIRLVDANYLNRGELLLEHEHMGADLKLDYAAATLENLNLIWGRPVHIATIVSDVPKRLSYDGEEHSTVTIGGDAEE